MAWRLSQAQKWALKSGTQERRNEQPSKFNPSSTSHNIDITVISHTGIAAVFSQAAAVIVSKTVHEKPLKPTAAGRQLQFGMSVRCSLLTRIHKSIKLLSRARLKN